MEKVFGFIMRSPWYGEKENSYGSKANGWYNGYVAIRKDCIPESWKDDSEWAIYQWDLPIWVHGGITFQARWHEEMFMSLIMDIPPVDELRNYVVFGWDYGHLDDDYEKFPYSVVKQDVIDAVFEIKNLLEI